MTRGISTTLQPFPDLRSRRARNRLGWRRVLVVAVVVVGLVVAAAATFLGRLTPDRKSFPRDDAASALVSLRSGESAVVSGVRSAMGGLTRKVALPGQHSGPARSLTWFAALLGLGCVAVVLHPPLRASGWLRSLPVSRRGPPTRTR